MYRRINVFFGEMFNDRKTSKQKTSKQEIKKITIAHKAN